MQEIDFSLIQLEGILHIYYPEYLNNYFNDSTEINVGKNKGLSSLYSWKNGNKIEIISKDDSFQLCSLGYFFPYSTAISFMETDDFYLKSKKRKLFPVIGNLKGDFLLVDPNDNKSPVYIVAPSLLIVEPAIAFKSLGMMLFSFAECFDKRAYSFIKNRLEVDFEKENKIFQKFNGPSVLWD